MKSSLPRTKLLYPVPGCWDVIEATQTWPGSSEALGNQEPQPLLAKAAGGRVGASSQASGKSGALQDTLSPWPGRSGIDKRKAQ